MEETCVNCPKPSNLTCSCNNSLRFCYNCYLFLHKKTEGNHEPIDLSIMKQEINNKFNSITENLKKTMRHVISKSNQLINLIQLITKKKLSVIKKYINACETGLKIGKIDIENMLKDYDNIEVQENEFESFVDIVNENFSIFNNNTENIDLSVWTKQCIECGNNFFGVSQSVCEHILCKDCSLTNIQKYGSQCQLCLKKCINCNNNILIDRFSCGKDHESVCYNCFPINNPGSCEICLNNLNFNTCEICKVKNYVYPIECKNHYRCLNCYFKSNSLSCDLCLKTCDFCGLKNKKLTKLECQQECCFECEKNLKNEALNYEKKIPLKSGQIKKDFLSGSSKSSESPKFQFSLPAEEFVPSFNYQNLFINKTGLNANAPSLNLISDNQKKFKSKSLAKTQNVSISKVNLVPKPKLPNLKDSPSKKPEIFLNLNQFQRVSIRNSRSSSESS